MGTRHSQTRHAPAIRTCVGCGARSVKSDLLRLVAAGNEIVPDAPARRPGRGAYLHPSQGCFEKAQRRRAFARALRLSGTFGTGAVVEYLGQARPAAPSHAEAIGDGWQKEPGELDEGEARPWRHGPGEQAEIAMSDR
ncbi:MAG TPA: YlxR family protein [Streptosporangiaceae bacterium]|nr:YlxR family protein [Streptosporangiaceae bacterium]